MQVCDAPGASLQCFASECEIQITPISLPFLSSFFFSHSIGGVKGLIQARNTRFRFDETIHLFDHSYFQRLLKAGDSDLMSLCPQMKKPGSSHWWEQRSLTNNNEWEVFIDTDVSATTDSATMSIVRNFASGETVFFAKFVDAYLKVSELGHDRLLTAVGADATNSPTTTMTGVPTIHRIPSSPTEAPESPLISPTLGPTVSVTHQPTKAPTEVLTITPASVPSKMPSTPPTSPLTSGPSKAPLKSDEYDVYENVGHCDSAMDQLISGPSTASECLEKCKETFSLWDSLFVEFFGGECFCQNRCPCLDDISSSGRTTMVPKNFDLPASCDEDSTSSPTPGPDAKYWAAISSIQDALNSS